MSRNDEEMCTALCVKLSRRVRINKRNAPSHCFDTIGVFVVLKSDAKGNRDELTRFDTDCAPNKTHISIHEFQAIIFVIRLARATFSAGPDLCTDADAVTDVDTLNI